MIVYLGFILHVNGPTTNMMYSLPQKKVYTFVEPSTPYSICMGLITHKARGSISCTCAWSNFCTSCACSVQHSYLTALHEGTTLLGGSTRPVKSVTNQQLPTSDLLPTSDVRIRASRIRIRIGIQEWGGNRFSRNPNNEVPKLVLESESESESESSPKSLESGFESEPGFRFAHDCCQLWMRP